MKVLTRYLAREIYAATALVMLAFLALFAFFDLIAELDDVGRGGYRLGHAFAYVGLTLPGRVYELLPVAVLIGSLYALTLLARHSEITVMRAAGMSTWRMFGLLAWVALPLVALTFAVGELVAPPAERAAQQLRLKATGSVVGQQFRSGLWVKDEHAFVNVQTVLPDTRLAGIRIYEFDERMTLKAVSDARQGEYIGQNAWRLTEVSRTQLEGDSAKVTVLPETRWQSALNPDILGVLLVRPDRMALVTLYQYVRHLSDNQQRTERYEIALWKKLVYPLAALVMMALALPFAFRPYRAGGVSLRVFAGVMLGIGFHMLNSLFSSLGVINAWPPLMSALAPGLTFLLGAAALLWLEQRR